MAEDLTIDPSASKAETFASLNAQLDALMSGETDTMANMANFCAALHSTFGHHWVGIYRVLDNELVLGPFQGPVACTRIKHGAGVCGSAWAQNETLVVPNVDEFPGHIACSSLSKSEIVVPIRDQTGTVIGVLDIDSAQLDDFDDTDRSGFESLTRTLENVL